MRAASLVLLLAAGCSDSTIPVSEEQRAQAIAGEYQGYGRVDDELRWAPFLCRQPMPGVPWLSQSVDSVTHGQKLYSVWVKDHANYPATSPVGQVVVKESFAADKVTDPNFKFEPPNYSGSAITDDHFYPYAKKDNTIYKAGAPAGLFVMYRVESGGDDGWIYATLTADRKVTASGRIEACMTCHANADHGRLFGVATAN